MKALDMKSKKTKKAASFETAFLVHDYIRLKYITQTKLHAPGT